MKVKQPIQGKINPLSDFFNKKIAPLTGMKKIGSNEWPDEQLESYDSLEELEDYHPNDDPYVQEVVNPTIQELNNK